MAGNSKRKGAIRKPGSKKGPQAGSGGKGRRSLEGKGPTPKAEDRPYHVAHRRKNPTDKPPEAPRRSSGGRGGGTATEVVAGRNAVLEALRLHPSVIVMNRRTVAECELGGFRLPPNTVVTLSPIFNHLMEDWWNEPLRFDPDRLAPPRLEQRRHSQSFVPFGGGAHACIGMSFALMQTKSFLFQMLTRFRFRLPEGYQVKFMTVPLPRPHDGLPLILEAI